MFFVFGINPVRKSIKYEKLIICNECGRYGRYEVYMTYMCLSIFFLPIIKWDKHYYVNTTCCNAVYELNKEVGEKLRHGENIEISINDLTLIGYDNGNGYSYSNEPYKKCSYCGYLGEKEFEYCPKCGRKL